VLAEGFLIFFLMNIVYLINMFLYNTHLRITLAAVFFSFFFLEDDSS
jgi:hypothetical protein